MSPPRRLMRYVLPVAIAAAAGVAVGASSRSDSTGASGDVYRQIDRFVGVLQQIRNYYVDETDDEGLMKAALKRMLADLDPNTLYLDSARLRDLQVGTTGKYTGVGIEISTRRGYPIVISPMEGTPASRAGVRAGDLITKIDGKDAYGILLEEASSALKGPAGTSVTLTMRREGEPDPLVFEVTRELIHIPSISACGKIADDIGYVRVARCAAGTAAELDSCLDELESEGISGLIIDLRRNPGGLLLEAVKICEQFLPEGKMIVFTRGRRAGDSVEYVSRSARSRAELPLAVLVDGGTASAAEIVAGAIQDWDLGLVVGSTTFGKGSVQRVVELGNNDALKLTTSYYYTPSGRCIHRRTGEDGGGPGEEFVTAAGRVVLGGGGIMPDVVAADPVPPELVQEIERRRLFFSFAVHYVGHDPSTTGMEITDRVLNQFKEFILDEGISLDDGEFESERELLSLGLRRELARRLEGDEAATLVAMEGDAQARAAASYLKRARAPGDLFEQPLEGGEDQ